MKFNFNNLNIVFILCFLLGNYYWLFSQIPHYNINTGSANYENDSLKINYVIGEVIPAISNEKGTLLTLPLAILIDSTNSIYLANNLKIRAYPNPTSDNIYISLSENNNYKISLINEAGQIIDELFNNYLLQDVEKEFNLSKFNIASGNYYLQIETKTEQHYIKFIYKKD